MSQSLPSRPQDSTPPLILPRGLIFASFLWLIGSWWLAMGFRPPLLASPPSYEPGMKLMLMSLMTGLVIGWPVYRLSQGKSPWSIRQVALDLLVMISMAQVVIWPLRLITSWPPDRTAALDASLIGWALLAGALVAMANRSTSEGPRRLAMVTCLGVCLLAPLLGWAGFEIGLDWLPLAQLSPLISVAELSTGKGAQTTIADWSGIGLVWLGAAAAWLVVLLFEAAASRPAGGIGH